MNRIDLKNDKGLYRNKLELGCGNAKHWREGFNLRLDKIDFGQDIVWNLLNGIPLPDNFCSYIYCSHTFEHLPQDRIIFVMNECWRVLMPKGELWIIVPHLEAPSSHIPVHLTRFNERSFEFFTGEVNPDYENLSDGVAMEVKMWNKIELIKNERPDLHFRASPKGK